MRLLNSVPALRALFFGIVIASRPKADAAIQEMKHTSYFPLDCFAIARSEGRASPDALWLAMTIAVCGSGR
jgi:hypothetical protein